MRHKNRDQPFNKTLFRSNNSSLMCWVWSISHFCSHCVHVIYGCHKQEIMQAYCFISYDVQHCKDRSSVKLLYTIILIVVLPTWHKATAVICEGQCTVTMNQNRQFLAPYFILQLAIAICSIQFFFSCISQIFFTFNIRNCILCRFFKPVFSFVVWLTDLTVNNTSVSTYVMKEVYSSWAKSVARAYALHNRPTEQGVTYSFMTPYKPCAN